MKNYRFENVKLILAEPNFHVREAIRSRLFEEGFRDIRATDKIAHVRDAVANPLTETDLLITDIDLGDGDVCALFHDIRHHLVGDNPFLPIIATSTDPRPALVQRVIDSGADDLLVKPLATDLLFARIRSLTEGRKPFIVTSEYIGPDRRRTPVPAPDVPLVDVPNPLRAKAAGGMDAQSIQKTVSAAVVTINERRMERHVSQIGGMVARVIDGYRRGSSISGMQSDLNRLLFMAEDIARRLVNTRYDHVSDLCRSMIQVTTSLLDDQGAPDERDVKLLPELADAIETAFALGEEAVDVAHDITDSVVRMGAR